MTSLRIVAEFDMSDFMRNEKGLVEGRTDPRAAASVRC